MLSRLFLIGVSVIFCFSCFPKTKRVTRVKASSQTDLSGKWNDTDARLVSTSLIKDCFSSGWLLAFTSEEGRKPSIRVRGIVNKTDEHIDAQIFIKSIEKAMVNSAKVKVLAQEGSEISSMQGEQKLGTSGALNEDSAPSVGNMTGADYVVAVRMASILDQIDGHKAKFYKINFELIHSSTGEKAWIGDHEIKKIIDQSSVSW